jgi:hypothetical protein
VKDIVPPVMDEPGGSGGAGPGALGDAAVGAGASA